MPEHAKRQGQVTLPIVCPREDCKQSFAASEVSGTLPDEPCATALRMYEEGEFVTCPNIESMLKARTDERKQREEALEETALHY